MRFLLKAAFLTYVAKKVARAYSNKHTKVAV